MPRTGAPTKFTDELAASIVDLIRRGNYLETACALNGAEPATVRGWLRKGKKQSRGKLRDFFIAVNKASAAAEVEDVEVIRLAKAGNWKAAAWRLQHRYPQRWNRTTPSKTDKSAGSLAERPVVYVPDNGRMPKKRGAKK